MKIILIAALPLILSGCVVSTLANAAVDVATLPVKVVSKGYDAATTSQSEADQRRGRELRKAEEAAGRAARDMAKRCSAGRPEPTDTCPQR